MKAYLFLIPAFILVCICCGCVSEGGTTPTDHAGTIEPIKGNLTLVGADGTEKVMTYDEVVGLPSYTSNGHAVSTVGIIYGPYVCTGVSLVDLMNNVGGISPGDQLWISAPDGYLWVLDYDQVMGEGFITFDEDLHEIASPPLSLMIMYEQGGQPLTYNDGAPFRLVITSEDKDVITEGSSWVKWVDRIEVKQGNETENS